MRSAWQRPLWAGARRRTHSWHDPGTGEHVQQAALFAWAMHTARVLPALDRLFAVPNAGAGAQRGQAGKMKAEGCRSGIPDLCLPVARRGYHGAWLEMKAPRKGARLSPEQRGWLEALGVEGYWTAVCFGADAGRAALTWYVDEKDSVERVQQQFAVTFRPGLGIHGRTIVPAKGLAK